MNMDYSVLMSVYYKEKPDNLRTAMDSIWNQTAVTDDFVLVCDGPLTKDLDEVIAEMSEQHRELNVVRLSKNLGLGRALDHGLKNCRNNLVARMDSDDISRKDRCEKQLRVFENHPDVSICSGTVEEFSDTIQKISARRILPEKNAAIREFAGRRNPFNHPCVMYKKSAVEQAGGYRDFYLLEDYYLWIRMLQMGCVGYNIPEPLLWMRAGSGMYKRRSGWKYAKSQIRLFRYMRDIGFIGNAVFVKSALQRVIVSIVPNRMRKLIFRIFLRKE